MKDLKTVLDPVARQIVDKLVAAPPPGPETGTPQQARNSFRESRKALAPQVPEVALLRDIAATDAHPGLRLYRAWGTQEEDVLPVLLFFHSGGWVSGDLETHDNACRNIANVARCAVIAVDYALAPERPFPASVEDALAAYKYLLADAVNLGVDPKRIVIGGDSAGANLAAVLVLTLNNLDLPKPKGQILAYPATDFAAQTPSRIEFDNGPTLNGPALDWFAKQYLADPNAATDWRASPLRAESHAGLPPSFVATCGHDPLRDEGISYADRLRASGVPVEHRHFPGQIHGFLTMGGVMPETTILIGEMASQVQKMCAVQGRT